ncbi:hypothetical protein ITJ57_11805 [Plantibacter sp. VKM Ac-2880]|uniref:hypothetical protein n=1 Tax=Plantibacter sp. VKM Ac-2880 TaxID=2783827 RepID=UPI00188E6771|nr:hypothetical protein [Plantibacter sp. VKM Ac-2880]MBF4569445.1 hypothetical protein [Plantibacter sp. VKM Ac-2880]
MATTAGWYPNPDDPTKELHFDGEAWGDSRVLRFQRDKPAQTEATGWYPHPTDDERQVHFDGRGWDDSRVLQLTGAASADGEQAPVYVSTAELPAPERENRAWTITKTVLSFGPIVAIAIVGVLAIVSGGGN